jgi:vacuolar-type H+-ATPase subunit F/Vma7
MHWVVIADELSALGWRLAGAQGCIATQKNVAERFAEALRDADFLLITADLAQQLPKAVLTAALLADTPLITVIAAAAGGSEPADLDQEVQHVLGIAV